MSLKAVLVYSLLTNAALAGAVVWQEGLRAGAVADANADHLAQDVTFREHVLRELSSDDPARESYVKNLCRAELGRLKPQVPTIWDPPR